MIHCDLNCFYASVEMLLNPSLREKSVAVCGSAESRHGIVLAKSDKAKKAGVKTGMTNWEAKQKCSDLIVVPPQYHEYVKFSNIVHDIYSRYTDRVEPFGMDECWCDLTNSVRCCKSGYNMAEDIRKTIKNETGLTVSIGVSFSKVFAKLGSDMKKPDAVTLVSKENFREKVWPLPASELLYIGRATEKRLRVYNVNTIGDVAMSDIKFLKKLLGVNGERLWLFANGLDSARVSPDGYEPEAKSVGHGITCTEDLDTEEQVWHVILALSQEVGYRLRNEHLAASGIQLTVRGTDLRHKQYQTKLKAPTQSAMETVKTARELFLKNHDMSLKVRAVTVRAINLVPEGSVCQTSMFTDEKRLRRQEKLEMAVEDIRRRYGKKAIYNACLMGDIKMPDDGRHAVTLPDFMYM